jgi:hypothetical protein
MTRKRFVMFASISIVLWGIALLTTWLFGLQYGIIPCIAGWGVLFYAAGYSFGHRKAGGKS